MKYTFENIIGFHWDDGNINKNYLKHNVTSAESEEVFFNNPLIISYDKVHSQDENRWFALGKTNNNRKLMLVYTIRDNHIRIISARDQSKKERELYEAK